MQHLSAVSKSPQLASYLRTRREGLLRGSKDYSLRKVAERCGITPAYLSRVERDEVAPPGEETLIKLALDLGEDPDLVLAMAGKISSELRSIIIARPQLFGEILRQMKSMPDQSVLRVVREVRDGTW